MGFDQTRFETKISDEFLCPICLDVLDNPVYLPNCDHVFCNECIKNWMMMNKSQTCPMDRKPSDPNQFQQPLRSFCNLLNRLNIRCQYKTCNRFIKLSELQQHEQNCFQNPDNLNKEIICPDCDSRIKITENGHNCLDHLKSMMEKLTTKNNQLETIITKKNEQIQQQLKTIETTKKTFQKEKFEMEKTIQQLREEIQAKNDVLELANVNINDNDNQTNSLQSSPLLLPSPLLPLSMMNNNNEASSSSADIISPRRPRRHAPPAPPPPPSLKPQPPPHQS
ncbi:e3 ubiquitin-protein ligase nrdp1-like [Dermatophagoides farinae]|uniref:E3 ubiquitin-protein ligase nrdp1-like n=1 Tax=Dermatophagoides farinae TaxID=6954 RepID=A0A9D4SJS2_DERFA|nr:e3 ubiquitin-protein ligase nrdp1-like [Dermatophagoides farinae]